MDESVLSHLLGGVGPWVFSETTLASLLHCLVPTKGPGWILALASGYKILWCGYTLG